MKKHLYLAAAFLLSAGFTACSDKEEIPDATETSSGFYTINGGRKSTNIPASITAYDYSTGKATHDAFYAANGVRIGDGAQKAIVADGKMYIAMYSSNLIWVVEPETLKIIGSIKPEGDATQPRALAAHGGKIYASMYTGYVTCINPSTLQIEKTIKVGPNPDQIAVAGNKLIVANSDGSNSKGGATNGVAYGNSSISIVDLTTWTETKIQDLEKVLNPTDAASNGEEAFVVCKGDYAGKPSVVKKVVGSDVQEVGPGTLIACNGNELYVINAPYSASATPESYSYKVYDTKTLRVVRESMVQQTKDTDSWINGPNGVGVDPTTGDIVILSYQLSAAGGALYGENTYANIYDKTGAFKTRVECGVGARAITFITKMAAQ